MEAPQNLEEANQQIHWKRVCIKGTFVRAIHMLDGFRELDSLLSFNHPGVSAHPDRDSRLAIIQRELVALQERAGQIVEEAYAEYKEVNPPKRDRSSPRKRKGENHAL